MGREQRIVTKPCTLAAGERAAPIGSTSEVSSALERQSEWEVCKVGCMTLSRDRKSTQTSKLKFFGPHPETYVLDPPKCHAPHIIGTKARTYPTKGVVSYRQLVVSKWAITRLQSLVDVLSLALACVIDAAVKRRPCTRELSLEAVALEAPDDVAQREIYIYAVELLSGPRLGVFNSY